MPKRDASNLSPAMINERAPKKTERSHEENQERAYIAASRRGDRSIEARVASARMASDIHRARTGKGFKISEAIVQAEEMYEEEEDDMPRSYSMLGSHLQTGNPEMDYRVNAYMANRVAMASMVAKLRLDEWSQNPINKLFAEQFPNANQHAQALSRNLTNSLFHPGQQQTGASQQLQTEISPSSPMSPNFSHPNYQPPQQPLRRDGPQLVASPVSASSPLTRTNVHTPPALSPSRETPVQTPVTAFPSSPRADTEPIYPGFTSHNSSFTPELPLEIKMMQPNLYEPEGSLMSQLIGNPLLQQQTHFPDMCDLKTGSSREHQYFGADVNPYFKMSEPAIEDLGPYGGFDDPLRDSLDDPLGRPHPDDTINDSWESYLNFDDHNEPNFTDPNFTDPVSRTGPPSK